MLKQEIRRILLSPFFYISIVILTLLPLSSCAEFFTILNDPFNLYDAASMGLNRSLYPILCGLALADSYLIERKSGYQYALLSRTSRLRYALTKVGVAIGTAIFLVLVTRLLLFLLLILIVQMIHGEINWGGQLYTAYRYVIEDGHPYFILHHQYAAYLVQFIFYDCLYASIFPAMTLVVSLFCQNRYIVLLSPYIYNQTFAIVFVGMKLYYISPTVMSAHGRASLLSCEGLPFRISMTLFYWILETSIFVWGVKKQSTE